MDARGCRFCGSPLQHTFVDLGASPLANSYLDAIQLNQSEQFYPLHVFVCDRCWLVQVEEFESPDHIFSDYAYFSSYSESWLRHAEAYTEMVTDRFGLNRHSKVVEIASNDGYLLQYFVEKGLPVLGIEPAVAAAEVARKKGIPTLIEFLGPELACHLVSEGTKADLLVGNNVLAHTHHLNDFVNGLKILLGQDGVLTMEFPHLMRLMAENQFDTIYHEHFSYFSLITVERVFARTGLTIFDVEELSTHGGSLRIYARHAENQSRSVERRVHDLKAEETAAGLTCLDRYLSFGAKVEATKRKLLAFLIEAKEAGKSIASYGAPAKGNTLLNYCGIRSDFIDFTVDRSPHKSGRYLPGTHIPIYHPDKIKETKPDYLLILPWNLRTEIVEQMAYIRDWGGQFVVPIPEVEVFA